MRTFEIFVGLVIVVASQTAAAQAHFPVVLRGEQLDRDHDRRDILLAELKEEQAAFAVAKTVYDKHPDDAKADAIRRHGQNVNALWRELKNMARNEKGPKGGEQLTTVGSSEKARSKLDPTDAALSLARGTRPKTPTTPWVIFASGEETMPDAPPTPNGIKAAQIRRKDAAAIVGRDDRPFVQLVND